MKRILPILGTIILTGGLAACSGGGGEPTSTSTSSETSTSSSTSATSSTTTTTAATTTEETSPAVEPETATERPETAAAASIFTTPGNGYHCAGTDAYVWDPSDCTAANLGASPGYDTMFGPAAAVDAQQEMRELEEQQRLAKIPYADGGTCAHAVCGYGHDANGNPNPSSGELQTMHGCEQGYITDQELCAAVARKAEQYGW